MADGATQLGNPEEASAPSDTPAMVQNSSTIARGKDRFKENVQRTTTLGATTIRHETRVSARKGVCNSYEPRDPLLNGSCGDLTNKQICELIRSPTTAGMVTAIAVPVRGNTNSDIIPYFAKNGLALTEEERSSMVVYKGICIQCNATKVPAAVLQVFVARHTCKRSSGQSPSHCVPTSIKTKNQLEAHVQSAGTLVLGGDADTCRRSSTSTFEKISVPSSQSGRSMCSAYSQAGNKCHTASSHAEEEENDLFPWEPVSIAEEDPTLWSISYDQLMSVDERIKNLFPIRNPTMRDVNSDFIAPLCKEKKKSFALQQNPGGLLVDAFISHSWDEPFSDFVDSIRKVFQTWVKKPNLWICAFALAHGDPSRVKAQVGTEDACLSHCPFVLALKASKKFVIVRNCTSDVYSRIWCVCELMFARKLGFLPDNTMVTGPNCFAHSRSSCIDAQATNTDDKAKILRILLNEYDYNDIDSFVNQFRAQDSPL